MMKSTAAILLVGFSEAFVFVPSANVRTCSNSVALNAKHAINKAAKKANHNRPRKSRPSDIHRTPVVYDTIVALPEYTIIDDSFVDDLPEETYVQSDYEGLELIMTGGEQTGWIAKAAGTPQSAFEVVDWEKVPRELGVEEVMASLEMQGQGTAPTEEDVLDWLEGQEKESDTDESKGAVMEDLGLPSDADLVEGWAFE